MKKFFEVLIAFMIHFGIILIFSTWIFNKLVGYAAPEYIAFMFTLWIFFMGMKMFHVTKPLTVIDMRKEFEEQKGDN